MPWRLEIHHIDVTKSGDATLIIAREQAPYMGFAPIIRSVLIDGGRATYSADVHNYIVAQLPGAAARLSAIIVTHYDDDHVGGIIQLLKMPVNRYSLVRIYDQGWPGGTLDQTYIRYVRAVNGRGDGGPIAAGYWNARVRVTRLVQSDGVAPVLGYTANVGAPGAAPVGTIVAAPQWLLTGAAPADPMWNGAPMAIPVGAPIMRFIAVNRFVRTIGGGIVPAVGGIGLPPPNEKSLAVEVRFGNFRYYAGGDIATLQENAIQTLLNNPNNTAGRVLAMKASHHGSNSATSRAFINRLRPDGVFISCGTGNQFGHPAQECVNVLDGFVANATGANPCPAHAAVPPAPPNKPVEYYLNGYQVSTVVPPLTHAGTSGVTAGVPGVTPGHIRLTVNQAQSGRDVRGGIYLGVRAAAIAAATNAGLAGGPLTAGAAGTAATAAAEAAMSFGAASAATAFLFSAGSTAGQRLAAANAANNAINNGLTGAATAAAVTAAALGAGNAEAAGAGAAAGVFVGGFDGPSLSNAVTAALIAAGRGAAAAGAAGAAVAAQAVAAAGQFTVAYTDLVGAGNVIHA